MRWALEEGTSHVGSVEGTSGYSYLRYMLVCSSSSDPWSSRGMDVQTYTVDEIEYYPHSDAELLEIQLAIAVDIGQIPDTFELVITELTVFEYRSGLIAIQMSRTIRKGSKYLPIPLHLPLFNLLIRHCRRLIFDIPQDVRNDERCSGIKSALNCRHPNTVRMWYWDPLTTNLPSVMHLEASHAVRRRRRACIVFRIL